MLMDYSGEDVEVAMLIHDKVRGNCTVYMPHCCLGPERIMCKLPFYSRTF